MGGFFGTAIYAVPLVAFAVVWVQLFLFDRVDFAPPIVATVLAGWVVWCVRDARPIGTLPPYLLGCFLGTACETLFLAPVIAEHGRSQELATLQATDPGAYAFVTNSTAILPLSESHRRRGLKVA